MVPAEKLEEENPAEDPETYANAARLAEVKSRGITTTASKDSSGFWYGVLVFFTVAFVGKLFSMPLEVLSLSHLTAQQKTPDPCVLRSFCNPGDISCGEANNE